MWSFIQDEILGMHWLNRLIGKLVGLDPQSRIGGSIQFFFYDVIKIFVLLGILIFVISSPMVDLGSLVLLMSIFGWKVAVAYVVLGLVIAVAGGTLIEKLHLENQVEAYIRNGKAIDIPQEELRFRDRFRYAWEQVVSTVKKVFPYVLVGVGIGAIIHNWIPEEFIRLLGSGNPLGVILATIAGVPMYADIFGTIPITEALLAKGAQLGAVLSFMMGVTTLSLPSIIMLRKAVKPKLLGIFVAN